jgi:hypothetical protein
MVQVTHNTEATEAEKLRAAEMIFNAYHNKGGRLEIVIHSCSKSNLTWRYSVRLWYVTDSGLVDNLYLNYSLSLLGFGKLNKAGYLVGNGGGIERSFQVAYQLGHALANFGFTDSTLEQDRQGYQISRFMLSY